jgi:hypothetical protein
MIIEHLFLICSVLKITNYLKQKIMNNLKKIINWNELSRYKTGTHVNSFRFDRLKLSKKRIEILDIFFNHDVPAMWEELKKELES